MMKNSQEKKVGWFHKIFGSVLFRLPFGNDGRGTPVTSGFLLMLLFLIWMVVFKVIPSL